MEDLWFIRVLPVPSEAVLLTGDILVLRQPLPVPEIVKRIEVYQYNYNLITEEAAALLTELRSLNQALLSDEVYRRAIHNPRLVNTPRQLILGLMQFLESQLQASRKLR